MLNYKGTFARVVLKKLKIYFHNDHKTQLLDTRQKQNKSSITTDTATRRQHLAQDCFARLSSMFFFVSTQHTATRRQHLAQDCLARLSSTFIFLSTQHTATRCQHLAQDCFARLSSRSSSYQLCTKYRSSNKWKNLVKLFVTSLGDASVFLKKKGEQFSWQQLLYTVLYCTQTQLPIHNHNIHITHEDVHEYCTKFPPREFLRNLNENFNILCSVFT